VIKFLCVVIDRETKKTLAEYEVESSETSFAQHCAADLFEKFHPEVQKNSWYVELSSEAK
jgi:hypothetical protein